MNPSPTRFGDWMTTATGRKVWPLDLRADEVDIEDIAQALSNLCRFGGRCREFYSVAQHSVLVSRIVVREKPSLALAALLHDAAEAYVGDVIRPIKPFVRIETPTGTVSFRSIEDRVAAAIYEAFDVLQLSVEDDAIIKHADNVALATESRDLMGDPRWPGLPDPLPWQVVPMSPGAAKACS